MSWVGVYLIYGGDLFLLFKRPARCNTVSATEAAAKMLQLLNQLRLHVTRSNNIPFLTENPIYSNQNILKPSITSQQIFSSLS